MLNIKHFLYVIIILFLGTANIFASDSPQTFSGNRETAPKIPHDMFMFGKLGDFIKPDSSLTILNIESVRSLSSRHAKQTRAAFFTIAPFDLHGMYRQLPVLEYRTKIPTRHVSDPTIIVVPDYAKYGFKSIIKKYPDTVILISAGNHTKQKPESAISSYRKHTGINIFHVGGLKGTYEYSKLHRRSSRPGNYGYAYISDPYRVITTENEVLTGTSFAVQITGAKLAMLYKALNMNHKWTMVDAMQLLMTARVGKAYASDLRELLVKGDNGRPLIGENGETFLLSENELRARLKTSPLYSKGE